MTALKQLRVRNKMQAHPPAQNNERHLVIFGLTLLVLMLLLWHFLFAFFANVYEIVILPMLKGILWISATRIGGAWYSLFGIRAGEVSSTYYGLHSLTVINLSTKQWVAIFHKVGFYALPIVSILFLLLFGISFVLWMSRKSRLFYNHKELEEYLFTKKSANKSVLSQPVLAITDFMTDEKELDTEKINLFFMHSLGEALHNPNALKHHSAQPLVQQFLEAIPQNDKQAIIKELVQKHHYETTFICGVYEKAKVYLPHNVLTLLPIKYQNTALWRALLSLGRDVTYFDASSIVCMYYAEKNTTCPQEAFAKAYDELMHHLKEPVNAT